MGKIPKYDQGKLASSMVGVPSLNEYSSATSAAKELSGLASDIGGVKNALFSVAQQEWQNQQTELRQKQYEQRQLERALETQKRQTAVAKTVSGVNTQFNDLDNKIRTEQEWDTTNAQKNFDTDADKIIKSTLDGIADPMEKLETEQALYNQKATYNKAVGDWVAGRRLPIAMADVKQVGDDLGISLNNADLSPDQVARQLALFDTNNLTAYKNVYGGEALAEMRKAKENAVRNYLADTAIKKAGQIDVATGKTLLDTRINMYDKILDAKDKQEFYDDVRRTEAAIAKNIETQTKLTNANTRTNFVMEVINQSPDGKLKNIPPEVLANMRKDPRWNLLTDTQKIMLTRAGGEAKAQAEKLMTKAETAANDAALVRNIGGKIGYLDSLAGQIEQAYIKASETGDKKDIDRAEKLMLKYEQGYIDVKNIKSGVQSKEAKEQMEAHIIKTSQRFGKITSRLLNHPEAKVEREKYYGVKNALGQPPQPYAMEQQKRLFNFWYNEYFAQKYDKMTDKQKTVIRNNPQAAKRLRNLIVEQANTAVEKAGFVKRGR